MQASPIRDKIKDHETYDLEQPFIYLDDNLNTYKARNKSANSGRFYHKPHAIIRADKTSHIEAAFQALRDYHKAGYYLAGYVSYELGVWLEPALRRLMPPRTEHMRPLIHFGVFETLSQDMPADLLYSADHPQLYFTPSWSEQDYLERYNKIQSYLRAGDCYQVNLSFPIQGEFTGDPLALFARLRHRQQAQFGGFIRLETGADRTDILSLSPELFFRKTGQDMMMRPMKGTLKRHSDPATDMTRRAEMAKDEKSQAENLMIVDLLRNDLSRLAVAGSVTVPELFQLETYPTLHQMTSKIRARLSADINFAHIFKSLFPCGSVTGAPKIRAMEIIDELEDRPRNAYCGAIGYIDPDGESCFNVAIRTLSVQNNQLSYNVGSGVVLDSDGAKEYAECLLKADILNIPPSAFIETLYYDKIEGYRHIGAHLARLSRAVKDKSVMESMVKTLASYTPKHSPARIHLRVTDDTIEISDKAFYPLTPPLRLAISQYPLTSDKQSFQHKVSHRDFYEGERMRINALEPVDEVIFFNAQDELCEGSFTNIFLDIGGTLFTPALSAGLLAGILLQKLVAQGRVIEKRQTREHLLKADQLYVGNSLRGLIKAILISDHAL